MAHKTLLTNSYIPTRPKKYNNQQDRFDSDDRLNQMKFNEIIENSDSYFENVKLTSFDLIHNECNGSELSYSRGYYQTYLKKRLIQKLLIKNKKIHLFHQRFNIIETMFLLKKKLSMNISFKNLKKNIFFLSNMRRMKFKKIDDCKNLSY